MTTYNNVLGVFSYAAHTLANTLWSELAFTQGTFQNVLKPHRMDLFNQKFYFSTTVTWMV